jgi:hypothetical protein
MGALIGAVARACALIIYAVPFIDKVPEQWIFIPVALAPTVIVGVVIGLIAASRSTPWRGTIVGALLSMATYAAWSLGAIQWYVLSINFNLRLTTYFAIAGALAGFVPFALLSERRPVEEAP